MMLADPGASIFRLGGFYWGTARALQPSPVSVGVFPRRLRKLLPEPLWHRAHYLLKRGLPNARLIAQAPRQTCQGPLATRPLVLGRLGFAVHLTCFPP